jgi:flagellar biosynthesis protein
VAKGNRQAAALRYAQGKDAAPRLLAKGRGAVADRILEIARRNGIPIREDRELVQVLASLDLYQEIPPELYKAVAEILVFLYTLNREEGRVAPTEAGRNG